MFAFLDNDQINYGADQIQEVLEYGTKVRVCKTCEQHAKDRAHNVTALFCSSCGSRLEMAKMTADDWYASEKMHLSYTYANGKCIGGIIYTDFPVWVDTSHWLMFVQYEHGEIQMRQLQTDPMDITGWMMRMGEASLDIAKMQAANDVKRPRRRRAKTAP
jgi:hypothetical protein